MLERNINQYDFHTIIDAIKERMREFIIPQSSWDNINTIKRIAWEKYSDNRAFDAATLNRKILLDTEIANLLTVDTLKAIFLLGIEESNEFSILLQRKYDISPSPTIGGTIYDALKDGVEALELIPDYMLIENKFEPNSPTKLSRPLYEQAKTFDNSAAIVLNNILTLAESLKININDFAFSCNKKNDLPLNEKLGNIIEPAIDDIIGKKGEDKFLSISGKSYETLENEGKIEFKAICKLLGFTFVDSINGNNEKIIFLTNCENRDQLIDSFIAHSEKIIHSTSAINLFLDKLHLQACIASPQKYKLGKSEFRLRDIIFRIFTETEERKEEYPQLYSQLKLRLELIEQNLAETTPRNYVPDNALRMIQLLEKYQADVVKGKMYTYHDTDKNQDRFIDNYSYHTHLIDRLTKAKEEENAVQIYDNLRKNLFTPAQLLELQLASFTNAQLLDHYEQLLLVGENPNTTEDKKTCRREIEGRLLRFEKVPEMQLGIEKELQARLDDERSFMSNQGLFTYKEIITSFANDFAKQTDILHGFFSFRKDELNLSESGKKKVAILEDIFPNWIVPEKNEETGVYTDAYEHLYTMRDQLLALPQKLSAHKDALKEDRYPLLCHFHAACVALGCFAIIGLPITLYAMYHSYYDKGTVFFTHAPETMRIAPAAEKSLRKLGSH